MEVQSPLASFHPGPNEIGEGKETRAAAMRSILILTVASTLIVSGCGGWRDARVNPSNWFGGSRPAPVEADASATANPLIPERRSILQRDRSERYDGTLVAEITALAVEPTSTGAIVSVTGLTDRQGAFDVRLVGDNDGEPVDGLLRFSLRALQPGDQGVGTGTARTVRAGAYVSQNVLERTTRIEVLGARNSLVTRR